MVALLSRRTSASAVWSRRIAWFTLALLLVASIGHRFAFLGTIAYFWVLGLVVGAAFLALVLAVLGFTRLWEHGDKAGRASLAGMVVSVLVLAPFCYAAALAIAHPRLSDIATDPEDPPSLAFAAGKRTADMNPIGRISAEQVAQQVEYYPQVTGRRYASTADRTLEGAAAAARQLGWEVVDLPVWIDGEPSVTMTVIAGSFLFGFPSDMAVRVLDEGESSYVDVRSASRYGLHDLGSNAARIETLLQTLDRIMAGQAGM